jgi:hypothetical protein
MTWEHAKCCAVLKGGYTMPELVINRLAPGNEQVQVEWAFHRLENLDVYQLVLEIKERAEHWQTARKVQLAPRAASTVITGLVNGREYELRLRAAYANRLDTLLESAIRLVRPGLVPGVVVNYIHPEDYTYNSSGRSTASPSIEMLPDGYLVASHDVYWGRHGQDLTLVFQSTDGGNTWQYLSQLRPCFWGKLLFHRGALYMLSTATEYGALLIRKSLDGGKTWSEPTEIIPAGTHETGGPHKAPVPVVEHQGRLWTAVEYGSWQLGSHDAGVVSVPVDADLLDPRSWSVTTPFLPYDPNWPGTVIGGDKPGVLEGNIVVAPDGELVNILRYNTIGGTPHYGKAIMLSVDTQNPSAPLRFRQVIEFPGNMSKFTIHFDPVSKRYWSLVNRVTRPEPRQRNILTLIASSNLVDWTMVKDILNYEENGWPEDYRKVGFQYVDWLFDGEDIIALSRTAINGAFNYHNANYITFHRIKDFRALL